MDIQIKISNLPQIQSAFGKAPVIMVKNLNQAIAKSVLTIKTDEVFAYRSLGIRVITGGLMGSIQRGQYLTNLRGEVGPNVTKSPGVGYAGWVHSGTRYMNPRPFLLAATEGNQSKVDKYFEEAVQDTLNQIAREAG